ncbi:MAG: putative FAD-linked oxidoreductase [Microbacterium sp.]|nr:putative FAD-linked oxidoreductase [Microbacterium sp.]
MTDAAGVLAELRAALGDRVDTADATRHAVRADKSGHSSAGPALAVVHAASVDDVQHTLRIASRTATPVVTRGAGTGLAGAANTGPGEIALSVRGMDRILEVRPDDLLAVVEPGVINAELNTALAEHGLWWAPDPASRAISTVGGNIATGAGGLLCAKYGVVRDAVLAMKVVLADGRLLSLGHRSVKGVTGYDLASLMIGSEGTLGVVVEATLKLRRLVAGELCTLTALFPDVRAAAAGASAVTAAGIQPAIMELMDAASLAAVHVLLGLPATPSGAAQLTIRTDGHAAAAEADAIRRVLETAGGTVVLSRDPAEGERLLQVRRSMHPAMETLHAGDGNLHPNFVFAGPDVPDAVWAAADELFRAALRLGGTLTGEHGIGVLKRRWLADELGDDQWELQRQIKRVFDPAGILNPGKVFAP